MTPSTQPTAGHTPGPWEAHERLSGSENDRGWNITGGKRGHMVGWVSPMIELDSRGDASWEGRANARLIAAAPELLKALRQELIALEETRQDACCAMSAEHVRIWLDDIACRSVRRADAIRKTIALATGVPHAR